MLIQIHSSLDNYHKQIASILNKTKFSNRKSHIIQLNKTLIIFLLIRSLVKIYFLFTHSTFINHSNFAHIQ